MASYDYIAPTTTEEVVRLLAEHGDDAHVIAGGASVLLMLQQQLIMPSLLVGLRDVEGMGTIRQTPEGGLAIGATVTHRSIERSPEVRAHAPALAEAAGHVATVRVRNQGTIGGNLAHADPAQDPPPVLLALDAIVESLGPDGARSIPIDELFVDVFETSLRPAEIITGLTLPPRPVGSASRYVKFLPRSKDDYATVAIAVSGVADEHGRWSQVRIAAGASGPVPLRIPDAEAVLEGKAFDEGLVGRAADVVGAAVDPIPDHRGSAEYKREMAMVWTRRALRDLAASHGERADA
jgi:carbon-monoxide dehydrogenase medium subunit